MIWVFNCSDQMDYRGLGNIFKGLAQTGFWGCFDEFNRISVEVLSVVASQVKCILDAVKGSLTQFFFEGADIHLVSTCGIFVTMNPTYSGRVELPDNVKLLFRPCAMVAPDSEAICEIILLSHGFMTSKVLARKCSTFYKLCGDLLSNQDHYDWGLRAIKSILDVAGAFKRNEPLVQEENLLLRALRDSNLPKIVTQDAKIFLGLVSDLFPNSEVEPRLNRSLQENARKVMTEMALQPDEGILAIVSQLDDLLQVRHAVYVVGLSGSGKSTTWQVLSRAMEKLPIIHCLDPKVVTSDELFGAVNSSTREWNDGLFSHFMRQLSSLATKEPKWIVLDGDIDPLWVESLNSVMDESKVLTLASNERIPLTQSMRLLFECDSLRHANPSTVSRAGVLFVNEGVVGWQNISGTYLEKIKSPSKKSA